MRSILHAAIDQLSLTAGANIRLVKVLGTLAELDGAKDIKAAHGAEPTRPAL